jgi:hypothetical protein
MNRLLILNPAAKTGANRKGQVSTLDIKSRLSKNKRAMMVSEFDIRFSIIKEAVND